MKLKFKNQEFQTDAVNAAVELFKGQEKANMTFSIADNSAQASFLQNEFGFALSHTMMSSARQKKSKVFAGIWLYLMRLIFFLSRIINQ